MKTNKVNYDETIEEIHRVREQIAAKFGGDVNAILEDARKRQAESGRAVWQPPPKQAKENDSGDSNKPATKL